MPSTKSAKYYSLAAVIALSDAFVLRSRAQEKVADHRLLP